MPLSFGRLARNDHHKSLILVVIFWFQFVVFHRTLQNSFEYLLQERQRTQSDESSITIDSTVSLIPELRSICESLSRKSSHSSKALYQFFHREINYLRDVCWELSAKIEASNNTIKSKGNSNLVMLDSWGFLAINCIHECRKELNRVLYSH